MKLNIDITCYYMGEMDNYNYSYSGIGKLFKPEYYFYKGTFYNGKKEGYGYTFKQEKSGNYFYYIGEWENNLPHGFGISYIYPKEVKKGAVRQKKLQRGKFNKGKFEAGIDLTIKEEETQILAEKYVGVIENDSYKSGEKIYRTLYKIENQEKGFDKAKVEVDYHYYYQGQFKGKLEHGKGMSVKTFPGLNYRYYYKGDFENGQMNGEGTIIFEGNFFVRKYEGLFEKDKWFCHFGKVYFKSGDIYQGFFDSNNSKDICGYYLHTNNDESKLRELEKKQSLKKFNDVKEFTDNEFESMKNFITHSNIGDVFFGEFHNDKKHGLGKYLFKSEKMLAVGRYLDGERNGKFDTAKNEALDERRETQFFGTAIHNAPAKKNIQSKTASKWVKRKKYYLIENDEIIDDSDKPF